MHCLKAYSKMLWRNAILVVHFYFDHNGAVIFHDLTSACFGLALVFFLLLSAAMTIYVDRILIRSASRFPYSDFQV